MRERHRRLSGTPFFVFRTPLLAFDELLAWSARGPDRAALREGLRAIVRRDDVREALALASPDLASQLHVWERDPDGKRGRRIEQALVRYFTRMTSRATPFGLFAGYSIGCAGEETRLVLADRAQYQRCTPAIAAQDEDEPRYRANSTIYPLRDRYRYVERVEGGHRTVAVDRTPALDAVLSRARIPATARDLAGEADEDFIAELIESQLLVREGVAPEPQVNLKKPAPDATLATAVIEELRRGVLLLSRLFPAERAPALAAFHERFERRYGTREVPLAVALDPDDGCGFGGNDSLPASFRGLDFDPPEPDREFHDSPLYRFLLQRLHEAWSGGAVEMHLEPADLERFAHPDAPPLPDAFAAVGVLASQRDGDFRLVVQGMHGPSGVVFLGRFCDGDDELRALVAEHLRQEEALRPDVVFAEVIHEPEGREANVVPHVRLREYELVYGGTPHAPLDKQIALDDLVVVIHDGRLQLRSRSLGREIVPRMTHAHNFTARGLPLYRFLGLLQRAGVTGRAGWQWGALATAPFLPRVTCGKLVLSLATWNLGADDLRALAADCDAWRRRRRIPRFACLTDGDAVLLVDFDNPLSVDAFTSLVRQRESATLTELYPGRDELPAHGPEGAFVHELIVPFVSEAARRAGAPYKPAAGVPRTFPPGSEWTYVKLYTGAVASDEVLRRLALPLTRRSEPWYFLRYADPEPHLRLRIHGERRSHLQRAAAKLLREGLVWRVQFDTYERELERYGGAEAIDLAERLFHIDSIAAVRIIDALEPGDTGIEERWRLALCGVDLMLTDFGVDLPTKRDLLRSAAENLLSEFGAPRSLHHQIGDAYRALRPDLESLFEAPDDHPLAPGIAFLRQRSTGFREIAATLRTLDHAGSLTAPLHDIVISCAHMHVNRLLRSEQGQQEPVTYALLARLCEWRIAR